MKIFILKYHMKYYGNKNNNNKKLHFQFIIYKSLKGKIKIEFNIINFYISNKFFNFFKISI